MGLLLFSRRPLQSNPLAVSAARFCSAESTSGMIRAT